MVQKYHKKYHKKYQEDKLCYVNLQNAVVLLPSECDTKGELWQGGKGSEGVFGDGDGSKEKKATRSRQKQRS